jgi:hypothetical protein
MSYFNSSSFNALLKKEMGCSKPLTFFCNKTAATISNEAKEKNKKILGVV